MTNKAFPFSDDQSVEAALEDIFASARHAEPPALSPDFSARLNADALHHRPQPRQAPGFWARLGASLAGIGGAPGLAGLGAAGLAGVWIGFAAPGPTGDLVSQFWQGAAVVSPSMAGLAGSGLADDGAVILGGSDLLSLLDGELE